MFEIITAPIPGPLWVVVLIVIALAALVYWWGRKSANHPAYAAGKEASFDALLDQAIESELTPAALDKVLARIRDVELVEVGQATDAQIRSAAAKAQRAAERLQVLAAELKSRVQ